MFFISKDFKLIFQHYSAGTSPVVYPGVSGRPPTVSYQSFGPGSPPVVNIGRRRRAAQFIQTFEKGSNSQHFNCATPGSCGHIKGTQQIIAGQVNNIARNFNQGQML
jgi:hypothetical protein